MFALRHLIPAAFRALFRMVFLSLLFAVVAGGITLVVAYANLPTMAAEHAYHRSSGGNCGAGRLLGRTDDPGTRGDSRCQGCGT